MGVLMDNNESVYVKKNHISGGAYSVMIFVYLALTFLGQCIYLGLVGESDFVYQAITPLFSVAGTCAGIYFIKKFANKPLFSVCGIKKFNCIYLLIALCVSVGMFFGLGFINAYFSQLLQRLGITVNSADVPLDYAYQYIIFIITLALLPAVFEELFFRGGLKCCMDGANVFATSAMVALAFSIYHCTLSQLVYQFIYGMFLYFLAYKSDSVFPSIIAHFINNFAVLTLLYFKVEIDFFNIYYILGGLSLLLGAGLFLVFYKSKKVEEKEKISTAETVKGLIFPLGVVGFFVCILMIVLGAVLV